ncbi:MAG: AI-2E family transporter [Proteobacteria bacterium]|nr:AI-2E family transporter [Pseudomonadota bacterium]
MTEETDESGAIKLLRKVPPIAGLPGPAVALIGLGIAAFAGLILLDVIGLILGLLYRGLGGFLTVILVSLISAYLLDPIIDRFERAGWTRTRAIGVSLSLFIAFDILAILLLVPYVVSEMADVTANFANYGEQLETSALALEAKIEEVTGRSIDFGFSSAAAELPALLEKLPEGALDPVGAILKTISGWFGGVFGFLFQWALFPIFVFFFLRDWDQMKQSLFGLIPFRFRKSVLASYVEIDAKMAQFLRGQFSLCCILAVLYAAGLGIFTDIDLAVLIGVTAGLLFIIPYFGTAVGVIAGTTLAVLKFGVSFEILKVWAVFGVVQGIEGAFLTPKIVGDSVGLHPVVVMLALVVGANLFGFLGILLGVPVAAALQVLIAKGVARYRETEFFREGEEGAPAAADVP